MLQVRVCMSVSGSAFEAGAYPATYSICYSKGSLIGCDIEGVFASFGDFLRMGDDEPSCV